MQAVLLLLLLISPPPLPGLDVSCTGSALLPDKGQIGRDSPFHHEGHKEHERSFPHPHPLPFVSSVLFVVNTHLPPAEIRVYEYVYE